ncbi:MAG: hypoxanthine phosphoribosyltransferase [Anaerolineales bacterium]|nr:hypoxanthine phosphoribosyltransferase [Anaerolineales bacterium]
MNGAPVSPPQRQKVLISAERIQARVRELAEAIDRDYAGKNPMLVCILRGGVIFLADLVRQLRIPLVVDFMAVSSYAPSARQSSGQVRITFDLGSAIAGRDVLVVEDIIDSGRTLASVLELLHARRPRSLEVCVLLDKTERRKVEIPLRYCGFAIPDRYVFGYGLDIDEYNRNLPYIAVEAENPSGK